MLKCKPYEFLSTVEVILGESFRSRRFYHTFGHVLKPVNRESQIEREIRPLAFCSVVIIFISLVTVHFYRLLLN